MIQANVHQAKTQLSRLIERAEAGEVVVIARNGAPAVRLTPVIGAVAHGDGAARVMQRGPGRNIVGCMAHDVRAPADAQLRRLQSEIAAEMAASDKFDVALGDELEFIPAARP